MHENSKVDQVIVPVIAKAVLVAVVRVVAIIIAVVCVSGVIGC